MIGGYRSLLRTKLPNLGDILTLLLWLLWLLRLLRLLRLPRLMRPSPVLRAAHLIMGHLAIGMKRLSITTNRRS